jgi:DNA-binding beta-propeller fold protein YncE
MRNPIKISLAILGLSLFLSTASFSVAEISTGDLPVDTSNLPAGYFLYVTNEGGGGGGTTVVQIADDGTATVVGTGFNGPSGLAQNTLATDPLLYVSDDNNSLYTQALGDVFTTVATGFNNPNGLYYDVANNDMYIAEGVPVSLLVDGQVLLLDLDTMGQTVLAQGYDNPQAVVQTTSGVVYFTDYSGDVFVINPTDTLPLDAISNPATVLASGVAPGTEGGLVMDASETFLYVSDYNEGKVFKVSTGGSVTELVDFSDFASRGLALSPDGGTLYITGYLSDEIVAYDLINDTATLFADGASTGGLLNGPFGMVISANDYPSFDGGAWDTAVLEDRSEAVPDQLALQQNYPNPFNSGTVIEFALPRAHEVDLRLYNLAGQEVLQLATGARETGLYSLLWDGTDAQGQLLASGVYLYRLETGDRTLTRSLLLLR